mmetsp:Transcript_53584/g.123175  ORF Transcript_53584/g.123175 Transcript_53584/m.123175 type:complete len:203 (+) Transcript_53584:754-1362(+)
MAVRCQRSCYMHMCVHMRLDMCMHIMYKCAMFFIVAHQESRIGPFVHGLIIVDTLDCAAVKFSLPFGGGAALDKRRGGQWYLGVRALDNVAAEFQVAVTFQQPSLGSASPVRDCSRFKPMCSSDSARTAWKSDGKARAPETSAPAPPQLPARDGLYRSFGVNSSLSSQTFAPPAVFVFAVVVLGCCVRSLYVRHKRRRPIRV